MLTRTCLAEALPNVHFSKRVRSSRGSFGVVEAELSGLRKALEVSSSWQVALPITGGALPIKPLHDLDCFIMKQCVLCPNREKQGRVLRSQCPLCISQTRSVRIAGRAPMQAKATDGSGCRPQHPSES